MNSHSVAAIDPRLRVHTVLHALMLVAAVVKMKNTCQLHQICLTSLLAASVVYACIRAACAAQQVCTNKSLETAHNAADLAGACHDQSSPPLASWLPHKYAHPISSSNITSHASETTTTTTHTYTHTHTHTHTPTYTHNAHTHTAHTQQSTHAAYIRDIHTQHTSAHAHTHHVNSRIHDDMHAACSFGERVVVASCVFCSR